MANTLDSILNELSFSKYGGLRLTTEQKHKMIAMSFNEDVPFFRLEIKNGVENINDVSFLYDFLSMRIEKEHTPDEIIDEMEQIVNYYKNHVSHHTLIFKTGDFNHNEHKALLADLQRIKGDISILEPGFVNCYSCNSNRVISISMQTRGGDEGTDTFNECLSCGTKWKTRG